MHFKTQLFKMPLSLTMMKRRCRQLPVCIRLVLFVVFVVIVIVFHRQNSEKGEGDFGDSRCLTEQTSFKEALHEQNRGTFYRNDSEGLVDNNATWQNLHTHFNVQSNLSLEHRRPPT
jgi:hypothetical protein